LLAIPFWLTVWAANLRPTAPPGSADRSLRWRRSPCDQAGLQLRMPIRSGNYPLGDYPLHRPVGMRGGNFILAF
jgi:hypothetical protein